MKVTKEVVTTYRIDRQNEPQTATSIAVWVTKLREAGVDTDKAEMRMEEGEYRYDSSPEVTLTLKQTTYYDESTLNRMEL